MDDDDAFLYGDASAGGDAEAGGDAGAAAAPGAVPAAASGAAADPVLADDGDGDGNDDAGSSAMEESSDDSSDEDVEIVMDAPDAAGARPAAAGGALVPSNNEPIQPQLLRAHIPGGAPGGMGLSVGAGSGSGAGADSASPQRKQPTASAGLSDYTPLPRTSGGVHIPQAAPDDGLVHTLPEGAEGPPPHAPATAPTLRMSPTMADLQVSDMDLPGGGPAARGGRFGKTNLYHLDPASMASKPWRRPGADLTDWFNYGFDEDSWARWATHQRSVMAEKEDLDAQAANDGLYANFDPAMGMLPGMNPDQIIATMPPPLQAQINQQLAAMQQQMLQAQMGMGVYPPGGGASLGAGLGAGPARYPGGGHSPNPEAVMPAIHMGRGPPGPPPMIQGQEDDEGGRYAANGANAGGDEKEGGRGAGGGVGAGPGPGPGPGPRSSRSNNSGRNSRQSRRQNKGRQELDHFEGESGTGLDYSYSHDDPPPRRREARRSASPGDQGPITIQRDYDRHDRFERRDDRAASRSRRQ